MLLRKKVGLALGGGGLRGFAHIGVIKILVENQIPVDYIAGTSIGALIGGFYATKKDIFGLEKFALDLQTLSIVSLFVDPSFKGFASGKKLFNFIESYIDQIDFQKLKIPFTTVATDLISTKIYTISSGSVTQAIRASCALPTLFPPVSFEDKLLVDGGLGMAVPVEVVRKMGADIVIAVNLDENFPEKKLTANPGLTELATRSIYIMEHYLSQENVKTADIVIAPQIAAVTWKSLLNQSERQKIIKIGEEATKIKITEIKKMIEGKKSILGKFLDLLHLKI